MSSAYGLVVGRRSGLAVVAGPRAVVCGAGVVPSVELLGA